MPDVLSIFEQSNSTRQIVFRKFLRHKLAVASTVFLILLTGLSASAPLIEFVLSLIHI